MGSSMLMDNLDRGHALNFPSLCTAPKWIKMFVLDEADEMLSRGFKDQIYEIFQKLSTNIQVSTSIVYFSSSSLFDLHVPMP